VLPSLCFQLAYRIHTAEMGLRSEKGTGENVHKNGLRIFRLAPARMTLLSGFFGPGRAGVGAGGRKMGEGKKETLDKILTLNFDSNSRSALFGRALFADKGLVNEDLSRTL